MMQQSPSGHVPVSVAQAALRVSTTGGATDQSKAPASPRPKTPAKTVKSNTKSLKVALIVFLFVQFYVQVQTSSTSGDSTMVSFATLIFWFSQANASKNCWTSAVVQSIN